MGNLVIAAKVQKGAVGFDLEPQRMGLVLRGQEGSPVATTVVVGIEVLDEVSTEIVE